MGYSIDQFSKITGISKLVLRTWENRYNFLTPSRTNTNIRSYSDKLLVNALNAKLLVDSGYKISFISKQEEAKINDLINGIKNYDKEKKYQFFINKIIQSGIDFNTNLFNKIYNECLLNFDIIEFYKQIMLPSLSRIGLFWLTNRISPAQEHFLSEMFKQKLYSEINNTKNFDINNSKTWILFLPPDEHHELGLLFSRLLLLQKGHNVIYLGANVPLSGLTQVTDVMKVDNILFFSISNISQLDLPNTIDYLNKKLLKQSKFLVTRKNKDILSTSGLTIINSIEHFISIISD
ncbi:MAG: hypothetical protein CMP49_00045 [Flavobacteriales bacterium]|nr:hypothetical protein [Flavobacteriales bacterium]|tara:strand:- start:37005 stop:37880 length:876 start_codon:yes stop_codon:yes gene_type:complete